MDQTIFGGGFLDVGVPESKVGIIHCAEARRVVRGVLGEIGTIYPVEGLHKPVSVREINVSEAKESENYMLSSAGFMNLKRLIRKNGIWRTECWMKCRDSTTTSSQV